MLRLRQLFIQELLSGGHCRSLLDQPSTLLARAVSSSPRSDQAKQAPDRKKTEKQPDEPAWQEAVSAVFKLRPSVMSPLHSVHRRNEEVDIRRQLVKDRLKAHVLLNQLPLHYSDDDADVLPKLTARSEKFTQLMETHKALAAQDPLPACASPDHMYEYYSLLSEKAHRGDSDATGSHLVNSGQADVWEYWAREFQGRYAGVPSLEPVEAIYNKDNMDTELERLRAKAKSLVRRSTQEPKRVSSRPEDGCYTAVGKRKTSVANVKLQPGQGRIVVNGRPYDQYFADVTCRSHMLRPLLLTDSAGRFDVVASVGGGGPSGQAQAVAHGVSKALARCSPELATQLGRARLLVRDPRMVERKKPGLKKARKAFAWVKR